MSATEGRDWDYTDVKKAPCNFEMNWVSDERPIVGECQQLSCSSSIMLHRLRETWSWVVLDLEFELP